MKTLPPYAKFLGISTRRDSNGELQYIMPFSDVVVGRPGYLHGGAIAGLLEFAAIGAILEAFDEDEEVSVKPINVTVNFMRGGTNQFTIAAGKVTRIGNRVANVEAHAWQDDRSRPIASAQLTARLRRAKAPSTASA
jgi:uncharacterized protein (TIGR00369 family)